MKKEFYKKYKLIIFDFDGVILDSNNIKKKAIKESVAGILPLKKINEFVKYFIEFSGIPREKKISIYFSDSNSDEILQRYEKILKKRLSKAMLIPGIKEFLIFLKKYKIKKIILSGGSEKEIKKIVFDKDLISYFDQIHGGPLNKEENLKKICVTKPILMFGDSKIDYNLARLYGFDFIFVNGYTSMNNWKTELKQWKNIRTIKDFKDEINYT